MRHVTAALLLLLLMGPVLAQEASPGSDTPEQAAEKVLAAWKTDDGDALKSLSEKDRPDPWRVVDDLCRRGEHGAAKAFAEAAPRPATETLPGYVEAQSIRSGLLGKVRVQASQTAATVDDQAVTRRKGQF